MVRNRVYLKSIRLSVAALLLFSGAGVHAQDAETQPAPGSTPIATIPTIPSDFNLPPGEVDIAGPGNPRTQIAEPTESAATASGTEDNAAIVTQPSVPLAQETASPSQRYSAPTPQPQPQPQPSVATVATASEATTEIEESEESATEPLATPPVFEAVPAESVTDTAVAEEGEWSGSGFIFLGLFVIGLAMLGLAIFLRRQQWEKVPGKVTPFIDRSPADQPATPPGDTDFRSVQREDPPAPVQVPNPVQAPRNPSPQMGSDNGHVVSRRPRGDGLVTTNMAARRRAQEAVRKPARNISAHISFDN